MAKDVLIYGSNSKSLKLLLLVLASFIRRNYYCLDIDLMGRQDNIYLKPLVLTGDLRRESKRVGLSYTSVGKCISNIRRSRDQVNFLSEMGIDISDEGHEGFIKLGKGAVEHLLRLCDEESMPHFVLVRDG